MQSVIEAMELQDSKTHSFLQQLLQRVDPRPISSLPLDDDAESEKKNKKIKFLFLIHNFGTFFCCQISRLAFSKQGFSHECSVFFLTCVGCHCCVSWLCAAVVQTSCLSRFTQLSGILLALSYVFNSFVNQRRLLLQYVF